MDVARSAWRTRASAARTAAARLAAGLLLGVAFGAPPGAAASDDAIGWTPGHGARLPGGVWVAGDATLDAEALEDGSAALELDDVSLLVRWEPAARVAFFGEFRLDDLVSLEDGAGFETGDARLSIERLYAEVLLGPALTLRAGKTYTPFGLWNVVRRAPLTWTVERPAITENVFPQHATGLSLLYQTTWQGWSFDATTYGPAQDELSFHPPDEGDLDEDGLLFGGRAAAGHAVGPAYGALGLNALGHRPHDRSDWTTATGLDLELTFARHQLTGELTFSIPPGGRRTTQGLYVQDVIPLAELLPAVPELYAVLRFEQLQPPRGGSAVGGLIGVFWRPTPALVLKADYFFASRTLDDFEPGLRVSLSLLF